MKNLFNAQEIQSVADYLEREYEEAAKIDRNQLLDISCAT